jgi:hypothetical protein
MTTPTNACIVLAHALQDLAYARTQCLPAGALLRRVLRCYAALVEAESRHTSDTSAPRPAAGGTGA